MATRFSKLCYQALQEVTEAYVVFGRPFGSTFSHGYPIPDIFEEANLHSLHTKRVTLLKKDWDHALKIRNIKERHESRRSNRDQRMKERIAN